MILLAGAAFLLFQAGVQAAPWSDDTTSRSDYERISRQSRKSAAAPEFDSMRLSVRPWATKGHGRFQSGWPDSPLWCPVVGGPCRTLLKSLLTLGYTSDFKDIQLPLMFFNYVLRVLRRPSFDVAVGDGNYGKGNHHYLLGRLPNRSSTSTMSCTGTRRRPL